MARFKTARALAFSPRCLPLGDVVYTPQYPAPSTLTRAMRRLAQDGLLDKLVPKRAAFPDRTPPERFIHHLVWQYTHFSEEHPGREPSWIRQVPAAIQRQLRKLRIMDGLRREPFAILLQSQSTGFGYVVMEGGLTKATVKTFGLRRLQEIKQLGYLHDPVARSSAEFLPGTGAVGMTFTHTRYVHVLDVMAVLTLILHNNRFPQRARNTARVAALCHDALTPAGGDTTKLVDPEAFDEDAHFPELLERTDWTALRERHRISPRLLVETVQGRGVLGQLLDIADKIAYVSRDLDMYLMRYSLRVPVFHPVKMPAGFTQVEQLADSDPFITGLWDTVRVKDGVVFFTDPDRLVRFLKLRALMFRHLYYNEKARYLEFMFAKVVVSYLYEKGWLTRPQLLNMTDAELDRMIDTFTGRPFSTNHVSFGDGEGPQIEVFPTLEAARAREEELVQGGTPFALLEDLRGKPNPGVDFLVYSHGKVVPLRIARPEGVAKIEELARMPDPYRVYSLPPAEVNTLAPNFLDALRRHREREIEARRIT